MAQTARVETATGPIECQRQPRESKQAHQALALYLAMDVRSIADVARRLNKSRALIARWSSRWQWVERGRQYDNWVEGQVRARTVKEVAAFRVRAAQQARAKAQALMMPEVAISRRIAAGMPPEEELAKLPAAELVALSIQSARALAAVLRAEALALGSATERQELSGHGGGPIAVADLSHLSDEDLAVLEELLQRNQNPFPHSN